MTSTNVDIIQWLNTKWKRVRLQSLSITAGDNDTEILVTQSTHTSMTRLWMRGLGEFYL